MSKRLDGAIEKVRPVPDSRFPTLTDARSTQLGTASRLEKIPFFIELTHTAISSLSCYRSAQGFKKEIYAPYTCRQSVSYNPMLT